MRHLNHFNLLCPNKARQSGSAAQRDADDAQQNQNKAGSHHGAVIQPQGEKAAQGAPDGETHIVQRRKTCRLFRRQAVFQHQIAAGPQPRRLLQSTVAEKAGQNLPDTPDEQGLAQSHRLYGAALRAAVRRLLPFGQAHKQNKGEHNLQNGDIAVARVPALPGGDGPAHNMGAHRGTYAPHAVQPAHVAAGVVQGHIVIQTGVHAARAQTVGHGQQAQLPVGPAEGKAPQRHRGKPHAEGGDLSRAEAAGHALAHQAGDHGAGGDDHGDQPRTGQGDIQLRVHAGPGGAQKGVGQAQADKSQVDQR